VTQPEPTTEPPFDSDWSVLNEQARSPWKRRQLSPPERPVEPPTDSDGDGSDRIVRIELLDDDDNVIGVWDRNDDD
jgi:hypothetical protein